MIDVHGQGKNNYTQFGYYIRNSTLSETNSELDAYAHLSSINSLVNHNYPYKLSDVIRGEYSMGTLLENIPNAYNPDQYLAVPSMKTPYLIKNDSSDIYLNGGFSVSTHGSMIKNGGNIDVIQIEIPLNIRMNKNGWNRDRFCHDFASVIIAFVNKWYKIDETCLGSFNKQEL